MTKAAVRRDGKRGALMRHTSLTVAIDVAFATVTAVVAQAAPVGTILNDSSENDCLEQ